MAAPLSVFLSVVPRPDESEIPILCSRLTEEFSLPDNKDYLRELAAADKPHTLLRVTAARLGAHALLPPLLRQMGLRPADVRLFRDEKGRPYLTAPDIPRPVDFNLSHSDAHVACACVPAPHRIGVDVEEPIPAARAEALMRRFCTDGERAMMAGASLADGAPCPDFTCLWTVREALSKYDGGGMPLRFDASAPPRGTRLIVGRLPDTGAALTLCVSGEITGAVRLGEGSLQPDIQSDSLR